MLWAKLNMSLIKKYMNNITATLCGCFILLLRLNETKTASVCSRYYMADYCKHFIFFARIGFTQGNFFR